MDEELLKLRKKRIDSLIQESQPRASISGSAGVSEADHLEKRQQILRQILSPEARERLANIRAARPELVHILEDQLINLAATGRVGIITDELLKQILMKVLPKKKEIRIERR